MDEILKQLRAEWQSKYDQATALMQSDKGTDQVQAEKLFDECDALSKRADDRKAELELKAKNAGRAAAIKSWDDEPVDRAFPFGAKGGDGDKPANGFKLSGFEPAGHARFDEQRRLIEEVGPGTFGEKTWQALCSFEYKRDFVNYLRKGQRYADRSKALTEGMDDQGGVFAPAELLARVIGRLPAPTKLRGLVTSLTCGRDVLVMPRKQYSTDDKYTTAFRATWTGEIPSSDTVAAVDNTNLLGNVEIPIHTAMLTCPFSKNLAEDSAFPIQAWLENELNQVIELLYEDMILNGTGIAQPTGILQGAAYTAVTGRPETVLSGAAGALAYDGLIGLQTALAPQYENERTRWVMNKKSTLAALMKLKDGSNRPLFSTGVTNDGLMVRRERVLLGDEIVLSQFMPDVGASNFPIIYGDLGGYYLANRIGFTMQVLDQTAAKRNQFELVGRVRFGGQPVEHWRLKIQKSNNS